jgi:hypothetical protein
MYSGRIWGKFAAGDHGHYGPLWGQNLILFELHSIGSICKNCIKVVKFICQKGVCQKVVKKLAKSCQEVAKSCQNDIIKVVKKWLKSCQKGVKKVSKSCQKVVKKFKIQQRWWGVIGVWGWVGGEIVVTRPLASASLTGQRQKLIPFKTE